MWNSRNPMLMDNDGDDVAFLSASGDSRNGLYGVDKRDLYERGPAATCSKAQAVGLTIFIFTSIFLTSLVVAFIRPFNNCDSEDFIILDEDVSSSSPVATNGEEFPWDDIRLPMFIRPVRYDIEMTPNLTTLWVKGIEKLIFTVTEETQFIVFHSKNITLTSRTINERLKVERLLECQEREQIYLETNNYMRPGITYAIRIKFEYPLIERLTGFYLSSYKDINGIERKLGTTHFEPTYARQAFPCFDEPQLKAKFLMTITHDRSLDAYFNTPKKEISNVRGKPDQIRDEFEETVEMSTYLVAFVICDFEVKSKMTAHRVNVSVIAASDIIDESGFALEAAVNIMDYYHDFFGLPYPLSKQDLIGLPDFGGEAMENWGLITFRELNLMYSEEETSVQAKQDITVLLAHELGHQWFGNLVTMKWWNDLWLNEGFASWLEYQGVDHIMPSWRMEDQFFMEIIVPALSLDSLSTSHPVSVPVHDPREIEAIFDSISYKKGAAIIHMLEDFIGPTALRKGLRIFLSRHKFSNAVTYDLWNAMSEAWKDTKRVTAPLTTDINDFHASSFVNEEISIPELMDTWTLQMGYPIVTFEQQNRSNIYTIKQSRFIKALALNDPAIQSQTSDFDFKWFVPLTYHSSVYQNPLRLLLNKTHNIEIEFPADVEWFKANINGTGFYRVNYPIENWKALVKLLRSDHTLLTASDRAQLINDAFSLSQAGLLPATIPLELCTYLILEEQIVPWSVAMQHLNHWKLILRETNVVPNINRFILQLILPLYNKLGWEDKGSHEKKLLRKFALMTALTAEYSDAERRGEELFLNYKNKNISIPPNLRAVAYIAGVKFGKLDDWLFAWEKFNKIQQVPSEKSLWMNSLAESTSTYILQRYLDATLDRTRIRLQDVRKILGSVAHNPTGSHLVWRHFQFHFPQFQKMFRKGSFPMVGIIESTISHFSTEFDYNSVYNFFRKRNVGSGIRALEQSIEEIRINIRWRQLHEESIKDWLTLKLGVDDF
nr:endoplasmic reticulum aminopeptidase 1-like isoform X3 [Lepeophtheirus salmonis]